MNTIRRALLECQQCGGPLTMMAGQSISFTTTQTYDAKSGALLECESHSGWCGPCIAEWNERMATPDA